MFHNVCDEILLIVCLPFEAGLLLFLSLDDIASYVLEERGVIIKETTLIIHSLSMFGLGLGLTPRA